MPVVSSVNISWVMAYLSGERVLRFEEKNNIQVSEGLYNITDAGSTTETE